MEGVIIFKLDNVGSKSEMLAPYLYLGEGKFERVQMLGVNPFFKNPLFDYDGKRVSVEGEYNDDDVFMITSVKPLPECCDSDNKG